LSAASADPAEIIDCGKPIKKLRAWIVEQNSQPKERLEKFDDMLDLACT